MKKIIIQDKEEKEMIFETLHKVEELDTNCKTFICDDWNLTSGTKMSEWFGHETPQEMAAIDKQISQQTIFDRIRQWANDRGIIEQSDAKTQFLKLSEEVGELSQAIANNNDMECIDAIGDCVIVLTNLAAINGYQIEDCIHYAYEQIEHRTGKMIDGVFIKE